MVFNLYFSLDIYIDSLTHMYVFYFHSFFFILLQVSISKKHWIKFGATINDDKLQLKRYEFPSVRISFESKERSVFYLGFF
jgi:hypothetical protein